ncbi:hypothetical protein [Rhodococcus jostii]|uniref:hypothetical protein n=1 Tax=Rhodococcus jostii TaxID=132919 RepID=UPI00362C6429
MARACLTEADRIGHPCPQLRETHTIIREALDNAATGDGDIYDARARQFAVTAGNYVAPAAGSPSVQFTKRMHPQAGVQHAGTRARQRSSATRPA